MNQFVNEIFFKFRAIARINQQRYTYSTESSLVENGSTIRLSPNTSFFFFFEKLNVYLTKTIKFEDMVGGAGVPSGGGVNGAANTGNGGGGAADQSQGGAGAGSGGSGVVIISVPTSFYTATYTGSPVITTSGANTILKFNASGSYTG